MATYKSIIPYGRQKILNRDIVAVKKVLKSEYLTQGPEVPEFEKSFKKKNSPKHHKYKRVFIIVSSQD